MTEPGFCVPAVHAFSAERAPALPWQPIATAPKDGTELLLCGDNFNDPWRGQWVVHGIFRDLRWRQVAADDGEHLWPPTHWMPLPTPPGTTAAHVPAQPSALQEPNNRDQPS